MIRCPGSGEEHKGSILLPATGSDEAAKVFSELRALREVTATSIS